MSARRPKAEAGRRRRRAAVLFGLLLLAAGLLLAAAARGQAARQRRAERASARAAAAQAASRRAEEAQRARLTRALLRFQGAAPPDGELLAALARATPAAITLREVTCGADGFVLRGRVESGGESGENPLVRFRRELCRPDAPWQIAGPAAGPPDFLWHGAFAPRPPPAGASAALAAQLAAARSALRAADGFDAWLDGWSRHWTCLARSAEIGPDLEVRHVALAYARPRLAAWSDIVQTVQLVGAEPGLTVDSLSLVAAPDGANAFSEARLVLTARLRR